MGAPRVDWHLKIGVVTRHGAFSKVQFSQDNSTGGVQTLYHSTVEVRNVAHQGFGGTHRCDPSGETQILDGDRHAVEGPQVITSSDGLLSSSGRCPGLVCHDRGVALVLWVMLVDALECQFRHFDRR